MEASSRIRSRNLWSAEEDGILRGLVEAYEQDKVDWRVIASFLPGRNNKDCRKRWHYRVCASMNLGPWSQAEDELLKVGIQRYGTHWSRVAQVVGTRNGDQCFKRWNDVLDPSIDRSPWTRDEDRLLLLAIGKYGRSWKQIVDTYFPGRTGLDAKNRHRQLTRKRKRDEKEDNTTAGPEGPRSTVAALPKNSSPKTPNYKQTSNLSPADLSGRGVRKTNSLLDSQRAQQTGDQPLSASHLDWCLPLNVSMSPPLPPTPYSSCSNSSMSHAGGSLSELDEYFPQHLTSSHVEHDNAPIAGAVSAGYPFFVTTPGGSTNDIQHSTYVIDQGVPEIRRSIAPARSIQPYPTFWGSGWDVTT